MSARSTNGIGGVRSEQIFLLSSAKGPAGLFAPDARPLRLKTMLDATLLYLKVASRHREMLLPCVSKVLVGKRSGELELYRQLLRP